MRRSSLRSIFPPCEHLRRVAKRASSDTMAAKEFGEEEPMAVKTKAAAKRAPAPQDGEKLLGELLLARAPQEDLAGYSQADLDRAVGIAHELLATHQPGACIVAIRTDPGISALDRPLSVVTIVNDNMPFLFDSVLGEVTDTASEPTLVMHPVVSVRHGESGVAELVE